MQPLESVVPTSGGDRGVISRMKGVVRMASKVPSQPLQRILEERNIRVAARQIAARFGTDECSEARQLMRIKSGKSPSVTERTADRLAIGLGFHPCQIWPEWGSESISRQDSLERTPTILRGTLGQIPLS